MNSISIKLMGGIGNVLFQIATAFSYSKKYNKKLILTTDDFVIIHKHLDDYKNNILSNVNFENNHSYQNFRLFQENGFHYTEIPDIKGSVYLNGYFQSEKYFQEYSDEIRQLFQVPKNMFDNIVERTINSYKIHLDIDDTCSIHVRRGDYLKHPNQHPVIDMGYYMMAIKEIGRKKTFLIFSDDINWCKESFPNAKNFKFIEGQTDYEDLIMQSACKDNIICNSTFSWWGAWLNDNKDKKVIAPKKWFGPAYNKWDINDLYPEKWIKI